MVGVVTLMTSFMIPNKSGNENFFYRPTELYPVLEVFLSFINLLLQTRSVKKPWTVFSLY